MSEEFEASDLVRFAALAEHSGFSFVTVSDHFHPITTAQGHSPFAWSTLGAIAENAKLFSASPHTIDITWAAGGNASAQHAAEHTDGMWATSPSAETVKTYRDSGGDGDVIGQPTHLHLHHACRGGITDHDWQRSRGWLFGCRRGRVRDDRSSTVLCTLAA